MLEVKKGDNKFYIGESEENSLAKITYLYSDDDIITVDHTYVSEELGGTGAGKLLLKELIDWARKEKIKIIPVCPFVKAQIEKTKEYQDMLAK